MSLGSLVSENIVERIKQPVREIDLLTLAEEWFQQTAIVRIAGASHMAEFSGLPNKLRGALGRVLMRGASEEAIAGRPCPWQPVCALDVFYREQARFEGRHGVPKPFVISVDRVGLDLDLKVSVFGFACDWMDSIRESLVVAARTGLPWHKMLARENDQKFKPVIRGCWVLTIEGVPTVQAPQSVALQFVTGVDATGCDPLENPSTLIARLARRIDGLARWQDSRLHSDAWAGLAPHWKGLHYNVKFRSGVVKRHSKRQSQIFKNNDLVGCVEIHGNLEPVWPLLRLGALVHVGRGATAGRGRYVLTSPDNTNLFPVINHV